MRFGSRAASGSGLSELKELLGLISDPKKLKSILEDMQKDVSELQKLYKECNEIKQFNDKKGLELINLNGELEKQRIALDEKDKQLKSRESSVAQKEKDLSQREKDMGSRSENLEVKYKVQLEDVQRKEQEAEKRSANAIEHDKEAKALMKEYEDKLRALKNLVK